MKRDSNGLWQIDGNRDSEHVVVNILNPYRLLSGLKHAGLAPGMLLIFEGEVEGEKNIKGTFSSTKKCMYM